MAGLHQQISATNSTVSTELESIVARLQPAIDAPPQRHPGAVG